MKMMYKLHMVRGQRTVLIGYFPTLYRAMQLPTLLDWSDSWAARITMIQITEEKVKDPEYSKGERQNETARNARPNQN